MSKSALPNTITDVLAVESHTREELLLENETHPDLSTEELKKIKQYRRKFMYCTHAKMQDMIYEWTKTNVITKKEHSLLCRYFYRGNFH